MRVGYSIVQYRECSREILKILHQPTCSSICLTVGTACAATGLVRSSDWCHLLWFDCQASVDVRGDDVAVTWLTYNTSSQSVVRMQRALRVRSYGIELADDEVRGDDHKF